METTMRTVLWMLVLLILPGTGTHTAAALAIDGGYAVVVSKATDSDTTWKPVVDALVVKYQAKRADVRPGDRRVAWPGFAASPRGTSASSPSRRRPRREFVARGEPADAAARRRSVHRRALGHPHRLRCRVRPADRPAQGAAGRSAA